MLKWFKRRRYRHFDSQVNEAFALKSMNQGSVSRHSFLPLIHYTKIERRYKKDQSTGTRTITTKKRPIKYSSHRDACILSYYASQINLALDRHYEAVSISESVIAYRSLGRANYDFAAEALAFAQKNAPVMILAFDVSGFFDNLDHGLLKRRLKKLFNFSELPADWLKVFRSITRFHYVDLEELKAHDVFGPRLKVKTHDRIASVEELKAGSVTFHPNPELAKGNLRGIPQGTPISAAASNLYMIDFDMKALAYCTNVGALYRRYSDDMLVICRPGDSDAVEAEMMRLIEEEKLEISPHKTEKTLFAQDVPVQRMSKAAQYLGFTLEEGGAAIRESSLARQWRKLRSAIKRARKFHKWRLHSGFPGNIHTKKLYRRFSHLKIHDGISIRTLRNFSSYGRRSAAVFGSNEKISGQVKRFERAALRDIAALKSLGSITNVSTTTGP
jgi:RNA-directed DNA polymerase